MKKRIESSIALQKDQKDCGVACLLTVIQYYGYSESLENLRELSGTTKQGTSVLGLKQAANEIGFSAKAYEADLENLNKIVGPVLLHITKEKKYEHYVVCFGKEGDTYQIVDPEIGFTTYTLTQLIEVWQSHVLLKLDFEGALKLRKIKEKPFWYWIIPVIKQHQNKLYLLIFIGLFNAILAFTTSIFTEKLVDELLPSNNSEKLILGITLLGILILFSIAFSYLRYLSLIEFGKKFNIDLIRLFFSRLLYLPKRFFDSRKIGDFVTRLEDTQVIESTLTQIIGAGSVSILTILLSLVILFAYDSHIAVINVLVLPLLFTSILVLRKRMISAQRNSMILDSLNNSNYVDTISGIDTIKGQNKEESFFNKTVNIFSSYQNHTAIAAKKALVFQILIQLIVFFNTIIIISLSSFKVLNGDLEMGNLLAIISISAIASSNTSNLALSYVGILQSKIAFERINNLMTQKMEAREVINHRSLNEIKSLVLKNIDFSFPGRLPLFKNINIELEIGRITSLIGESGSGKSTLFNLIQRFYTINSEKLICNGNELTLDVLTWRKSLGVVPQEIKVFNSTLLENITLENDTHESSRVRVLSLFEKYGLQFFLDQMPFGLKTLVGEEGIDLSGGQKQLLGLLRALYGDPKLLLLDESTSALDRLTEKHILGILELLKSEMPIFLITHRIMTAAKTDYIYILDNQMIIDHGTPRELSQYPNMFSDCFKESLEI
uniref:peptidase domain-containing ABC transporter n=1 Tax=Roseivirga sp. TaxID=1964215 RepID=UPI004047DBA2